MLITSQGGQMTTYGSAGQMSGAAVAKTNAQPASPTVLGNMRLHAADLVQRLADIDERLRRVVSRATGRGYPADKTEASPRAISGEVGALSDELSALGRIAEQLVDRVKELDEIV